MKSSNLESVKTVTFLGIVGRVLAGNLLTFNVGASSG